MSEASQGANESQKTMTGSSNSSSSNITNNSDNSTTVGSNRPSLVLQGPIIKRNNTAKTLPLKRVDYRALCVQQRLTKAEGASPTSPSGPFMLQVLVRL